MLLGRSAIAAPDGLILRLPPDESIKNQRRQSCTLPNLSIGRFGRLLPVADTGQAVPPWLECRCKPVSDSEASLLAIERDRVADALLVPMTTRCFPGIREGIRPPIQTPDYFYSNTWLVART